MRSRDSLALAGILLLATAVRLVAIGSRLNVDDGYSWLVATAPSAQAFLHQLAATENTPPLFYLLLTPLPTGHAGWLRVPAAVPGVLMCLVIYLALRRPLGTRTALLAALAAAVAPLLVTYSDLARGFMLGDLALLVALWAVLRLAEGESIAWWLIYIAAGLVAVYSEYDSAVFLLALSAAALWVGAPARRRMALIGPLPLLALIPWIPQMVRAQDAVGKTKLSPTFPAPSLTALRDATVTLAFGEYGGTTSAIGRWLEFLVFVGLGVLIFVVLRRAGGPPASPRRRAIALIARTGALVLIGHAIGAALGYDIFNQRYLTILIPIGGALAAAAIVATGRREVVIAAAAALAALGVGNIARRYNHQWLPSLAPVRSAVVRLHPRTILTNNPTVLYYLRPLRPQLDRPFNLGVGRADSCARPCLIVDDRTVYTGVPRPVGGTPLSIGNYELTLER